MWPSMSVRWVDDFTMIDWRSRGQLLHTTASNLVHHEKLFILTFCLVFLNFLNTEWYLFDLSPLCFAPWDFVKKKKKKKKSMRHICIHLLQAFSFCEPPVMTALCLKHENINTLGAYDVGILYRFFLFQFFEVLHLHIIHCYRNRVSSGLD